MTHVMLLASVRGCDGHSANVSGSLTAEHEAAIATILRTPELSFDGQIVAARTGSACN
jgi:hypothetical protein